MAFLGDYPNGATFGATVGRRSDQGRAMFGRYRRSAVELSGEVFNGIRAIVADLASGSNEAMIRGGSCIVVPFGRFLAGPSTGTTDVLVADIDLEVLDGAYLDLDVAGRYARLDQA